MSDIEQKIIEKIADRLSKDVADINSNSNIIADLGADSLDIAEIMMDLEDEFNIKVEEDAEGLNTIGDIVKFIEGQVNA